ncbi:MAG: S-layer homology domain-containing protein [Bacillota bacterium]
MKTTHLGRFVAAVIAVVMLAAAMAALPAGLALAAEPEYTDFTVYFPLYTKLGSFVYPVRHLVPKTDAPAKASMEALIAGYPGGPFLPLPKETKVLGVTIKDGLATVDFSPEIKGANVGSGGEAAILSAIVATLGQFQGVTAVQILVNGEKLDSLAGHVDITEPLSTEGVFGSVFQVLDDVYQHWSGGAVGVLMAWDVLDGYPDGTYRPDNKVTRAEFIKMLVEGLKLPYASGEAVPFADVTGKWHEDYVRRALASGLIKASDYGQNLKPDEVIPRGEMAALLVTASAAYLKQHPEVDYQEVSPAPVFADLNTATEKYRTAIQESANRGFIAGFPDGTYRPMEGLSRGEAATVIVRLLGMAETSDPTFKHVIRMNPLQGAEWDGGSLYALGAASAFEANVNWRIAGVAGDILFSYVTATQGMGWGLWGLHVDPALFADQSPTMLEFFLVSMKDGQEYSKVSLPLN